MPAAVLTYSPKDVTIVICGYTLTGILGVELLWNSKPFTIKRGIRGVHTRIYNKDLSGTIRLEVQQTSITNDILSDILTQDRTNKSARIDVTIKDTGGSTIYATSQAFIPSFPNIKLDMGFNTRVWDIEVLQLTVPTLGGNAGGGLDILGSIDGALDLLGSAATKATDAIVDVLPTF